METTGCGTAIVTPFTADRDPLTKRRCGRWSTGRSTPASTFSWPAVPPAKPPRWMRKSGCCAVCIVAEAAAGRVPVWAGCTHNSTRTLLRQAEPAATDSRRRRRALRQSLLQQALAGGAVSALPGAGQAVDPLPVTLYNIPGRTGVNLEPETVLRLAEAAPNIQAIKESSGKLPQIARAGAHPAARLQDLLRRRQPGAGLHRRRRARAHQRGRQRNPRRDGPHDPRRAGATTGPRPASSSAAYARLIDANFWDSNPTPGEDRAQPDGPQLRPRPPAAGSALCRDRAELERLAGELGLLKHAAAVRTAGSGPNFDSVSRLTADGWTQGHIIRPENQSVTGCLLKTPATEEAAMLKPFLLLSAAVLFVVVTRCRLLRLSPPVAPPSHPIP